MNIKLCRRVLLVVYVFVAGVLVGRGHPLGAVMLVAGAFSLYQFFAKAIEQQRFTQRELQKIEEQGIDRGELR